MWAADGVQAMSKAREHQPDTILLDLGLPGRDGSVELERFRDNRQLADIPVVTVTIRDHEVAEE